MGLTRAKREEVRTKVLETLNDGPVKQRTKSEVIGLVRNAIPGVTQSEVTKEARWLEERGEITRCGDTWCLTARGQLMVVWVRG